MSRFKLFKLFKSSLISTDSFEKSKSRLSLKDHVLLNVKKYLAYSIFLSTMSIIYIFSTTKRIKDKVSVKTSSMAGKIMDLYIPVSLRKIIYKAYIKKFKVNQEDILEKDLTQYKTLNEFFIRKIDMSKRPVDESAVIVSPCDGKVLSFSPIIDMTDMIVVKNQRYNLLEFLYGRIGRSPRLVDVLNCKPDEKWYQLTIYLSPADYHRYHSPCDLKINDRVYIPGALYPVKPSYVEKYPNTFIENERVTIKCDIKDKENEGRMLLMTFVGALNVGSINLNYEGFTNKGHKKKVEEHVSYDNMNDSTNTRESSSVNLSLNERQRRKDSNTEFGKEFLIKDISINRLNTDSSSEDASNDQKDPTFINKLEELGYFKFGSTIVLVFPLKEGEKISENIKAGNVINLGSRIL